MIYIELEKMFLDEEFICEDMTEAWEVMRVLVKHNKEFKVTYAKIDEELGEITLPEIEEE